MSKYLLLYRTAVPLAEMFANVTPEQQKQFSEAWLAWDASIGSAMLDPGNPTMLVSDPKAGGDHVGGYAIVEAENPEAVDKMLATHPFLANGGTAGVYQVMEM